MLVQDESHLLKNIKAKSTTAAIELTKRAKRVVLLTGTPALSRPSELFTQLQIIDPSFFSFREYCKQSELKYKYIFLSIICVSPFRSKRLAIAMANKRISVGTRRASRIWPN